MGEKRNNDSIIDWIEEETLRLKKLAEEAIQRELQKELLDNMIKKRLEDKIERLQEILNKLQDFHCYFDDILSKVKISVIPIYVTVFRLMEKPRLFFKF